MKTKTLLYSLLFILLTAGQSCKKDSTLKDEPVSEITNSQSEDDATAVVDTSLLCYLPFNGNFKDKSGNNNNGKLIGPISFVDDRFGNPSKAISFSGTSSSYIEIPETQFAGLKSMTISMDFYPISTSHQELISKMSFDAPYNSLEWYQSFTAGIEAGGTLDFDIRQENFCNNLNGGWNPVLFANSPVIYNSWNHMAITFDDNIQKIYLNGNLVDTDVKTASPICSGGPIRLAVWWQTDPLYFTGKMDEVKLFKRVLSDKEIRKLSTK